MLFCRCRRGSCSCLRLSHGCPYTAVEFASYDSGCDGFVAYFVGYSFDGAFVVGFAASFLFDCVFGCCGS